MPVNQRVRMEEFTAACDAYNDDLMVDVVRGKWQIFEATCEYNPVTGGHVRKGKVVRRYDPDAGDSEGKPARFDTKEEAIMYCDRWLKTTKARPAR